MRKNMKLFILASALLLAACSQNENDPGAEPGGGIVLTPTVALSAGWNTGTNTRADQKVPVTLAPGGNIMIMIASEEEVTAKPDVLTTLYLNYFEVTADGKLSRIPFSGAEMETEEPLNIAAPGRYIIQIMGYVNLMTDGITYRSCIGSENDHTGATIGTDGKFSQLVEFWTGGLRLNVKGTDGAAYTGADVTATLKTVSQNENKAFEVKTLTAAAPSVIWGDIDSNSSVAAGTQILELVVDGKTYKVNAPRQISFTAGRLYTFNVRVGATGITVSSDDLSIGDFEVQASTAGEAEFVPFYNGQHPNLLALDGCTPYWVAPVNATTGQFKWISIDFATICPEGWHVPTLDEYCSMTGASGPDVTITVSDPAAFAAAFDSDRFKPYWTTTYDEGNVGAYVFGVSPSGLTSATLDDATAYYDYSIRCVRKK